jgi:uncharacterized protein (TIGR02453 family)
MRRRFIGFDLLRLGAAGRRLVDRFAEAGGLANRRSKDTLSSPIRIRRVVFLEARGMVSRGNPFGPGLIRFLEELECNNDRAWFRARAGRYEEEVREPALAFIRAMARHVERISPHLVASDRKVGGSLMRIHRDVRFSRDKRPYKTNVGIQFRHEAGRDVHAPGLYFHVDPAEIFLGAGMWRPDAGSLAAVRRSIDGDRRGWRRVRDARRFREVWELSGESLRRAPLGFAADHPLIEDLKRKDHIAICRLTPRDILRRDLVDFVGERFGRAGGYLAWLASALDLAF